MIKALMEVIMGNRNTGCYSYEEILQVVLSCMCQWPIKKFYEWYYLACAMGHEEIPRDIFKTSHFDLHVNLAELDTIYRLRMLSITMMTDWCM
jgi:hypothetical protein